MRLVAILLLALALPAWAGDWRDADWGMPMRELRLRFALDPTDEPTRFLAPVETIAGVRFQVVLEVGGKPPGLAKVEMISTELLSSFRDEEFQRLLRLLDDHYGGRVRAQLPEPEVKVGKLWSLNREVVWGRGRTEVALIYFYANLFAEGRWGWGSDVLAVTFKPRPTEVQQGPEDE